MHIEDVGNAGGVSAVLFEIAKRGDVVRKRALTVTGETIGDRIQGAEATDRRVIRSVDDPYSAVGGIAILHGNLATEGAVVKTAGIEPGLRRMTGKAICFDSQDDAIAGIMGGKVHAGHMVIIRYEGPKGGPGMQEMLSPTSLIMGMGLGRERGARDRREVLRRHPRRLRRARLAGGGRGGRHRARARRRRGHGGHRPPEARGRAVAGGVDRRRAAHRPRKRTSRRSGSGATPRWWRTRRRARCCGRSSRYGSRRRSSARVSGRRLPGSSGSRSRSGSRRSIGRSQQSLPHPGRTLSRKFTWVNLVRGRWSFHDGDGEPPPHDGVPRSPRPAEEGRGGESQRNPGATDEEVARNYGRPAGCAPRPGTGPQRGSSLPGRLLAPRIVTRTPGVVLEGFSESEAIIPFVLGERPFH